MGTDKLFNKSRPDKRSNRMIHGSLPLKKRKLRSNLVECAAQDSHLVTVDSSVTDVNSDIRTSLSTPRVALSLSMVPQVSPTLACLPTLDPSSPDTFPSANNIPRIKKTLPRLVTPLPNGCHWQTSRHKSYCRRQPCYNGSNFCKLHFQQYSHNKMVPTKGGGRPSPTDQDTTSSSVHKPTEGAPMLPNIFHQDKRFTEAPGQVQCLATTTRGRPCAYVSVNGTKYCYLHSQYEKSRPAPRRSSYTATMSISPSSSSSSSSSQSPLCSLPTVSWLNQTVTISVGPLQNSTGTVEKWGNGWVSVRVPGVGLHNRRSFELLVTPPSKKQDESSQARQVTDSSSSDDESSNRSLAKSPIPTLILAQHAPPQRIVSPNSV